MLFVLAVVLVAAIVLAPQLAAVLCRKKTLRRNWEELVASLEPVNLEGIRSISDMFLIPTKDQLRLEPAVMWQMLGGFKGIHQLSRNAERMLELCVYAERWNCQGPVISEMIRLDAVNLNKAIRNIELAFALNFGHVRGHFAIMEAAAHYDLMRRRLLGFYEQSHVGRLPLLQAQLGT